MSLIISSLSKPIFCNTVASICRTNLIHTNAVLFKSDDRRQMKASMPVKDEGTLGEKTINIDSMISQ